MTTDVTDKAIAIAAADCDLDALNSLKRPRNKFSLEEDQTILKCVKESGPHGWKDIAAHLPGRTARQIRERYTNYLNPVIKTGEWSKEEDDLLISKVKEYGKTWSKIAKHFPARTDVILKNRFARLCRIERKALTKSLSKMKMAHLVPKMPMINFKANNYSLSVSPSSSINNVVNINNNKDVIKTDDEEIIYKFDENTFLSHVEDTADNIDVSIVSGNAQIAAVSTINNEKSVGENNEDDFADSDDPILEGVSGWAPGENEYFEVSETEWNGEWETAIF